MHPVFVCCHYGATFVADEEYNKQSMGQRREGVGLR